MVPDIDLTIRFSGLFVETRELGWYNQEPKYDNFRRELAQASQKRLLLAKKPTWCYAQQSNLKRTIASQSADIIGAHNPWNRRMSMSNKTHIHVQ